MYASDIRRQEKDVCMRYKCTGEHRCTMHACDLSIKEIDVCMTYT